MALKQYDVEINGINHTLQLSDEDVKQYKNAKEVKAKQAPAPQNKQAPAPATN
ncbi:hypothetical protein [Herbiconiux solani]|uniref:hypothetical protein n=1 Tax=Herbiconiux solani TaxID=661329 RepID=UPI0012EE7858|nr:hypothetical protein [Herbiconiux solani]